MNARPLPRRLTGACLIAAPLVLLVGLLLTPYPAHSDTRSQLAIAALHPTTTQIAAVIIELGYVLLVPAVFGLIGLTAEAPQWLRIPGAVLAVTGTAILPGLLVTDIVNLSLAQQLPRDLGVAVHDSMIAGVIPMIMAAPAAVGLVLGTPLLAAAAWRSGNAPAWAAPLVLAGWVVGHPLALVPATIGGTMVLAGLSAIGWQVLRSPDTLPSGAGVTSAPQHRR